MKDIAYILYFVLHHVQLFQNEKNTKEVIKEITLLSRSYFNNEIIAA